jgi:hypothetical protein
MLLVCCRCEKRLGTVPGPDATSHGLCPPCAQAWVVEIETRTPRPSGLRPTG